MHWPGCRGLKPLPVPLAMWPWVNASDPDLASGEQSFTRYFQIRFLETHQRTLKMGVTLLHLFYILNFSIRFHLKKGLGS